MNPAELDIHLCELCHRLCSYNLWVVSNEHIILLLSVRSRFNGLTTIIIEEYSSYFLPLRDLSGSDGSLLRNGSAVAGFECRDKAVDFVWRQQYHFQIWRQALCE